MHTYMHLSSNDPPDPQGALIEARRAEILQNQAQLALFHYCFFSHYKQKHLQQQQQHQLSSAQCGKVLATQISAPNSAVSTSTLPLLGLGVGANLTSHFPAMTSRLEGGCGPINAAGPCSFDGGHVESGSDRLGKLLVLLQLLSNVMAADVETFLFPDLNVKGLIRSLFIGT